MCKKKLSIYYLYFNPVLCISNFADVRQIVIFEARNRVSKSIFKLNEQNNKEFNTRRVTTDLGSSLFHLLGRFLNFVNNFFPESVFHPPPPGASLEIWWDFVVFCQS